MPGMQSYRTSLWSGQTRRFGAGLFKPQLRFRSERSANPDPHFRLDFLMRKSVHSDTSITVEASVSLTFSPAAFRGSGGGGASSHFHQCGRVINCYSLIVLAAPACRGQEWTQGYQMRAGSQHEVLELRVARCPTKRPISARRRPSAGVSRRTRPSPRCDRDAGLD